MEGNKQVLQDGLGYGLKCLVYNGSDQQLVVITKP